MKVVINRCFGGFGLSLDALARYADLKGKTAYFYLHDGRSGKYKKTTIDKARKKRKTSTSVFVFTSNGEDTLDESSINNSEWLYDRYIPRNDKALVQVVEELGADANSLFASLDIVDIPDDVDFVIEEYDGREWVSERHRTW